MLIIRVDDEHLSNVQVSFIITNNFFISLNHLFFFPSNHSSNTLRQRPSSPTTFNMRLSASILLSLALAAYAAPGAESSLPAPPASGSFAPTGPPPVSGAAPTGLPPSGTFSGPAPTGLPPALATDLPATLERRSDSDLPSGTPPALPSGTGILPSGPPPSGNPSAMGPPPSGAAPTGPAPTGAAPTDLPANLPTTLQKMRRSEEPSGTPPPLPSGTGTRPSGPPPSGSATAPPPSGAAPTAPPSAATDMPSGY